MVFFFLLDVITSSALYVTFKCGTWIVYGTANGIHYVYNKITTANQNNGNGKDGDGGDEDEPSYICTNTNNDSYEKNNEFIILTRQEYEELKSRCSDTK
jgi:hypothetical protein